jgi:hypothetical protein
MSKLKIMGMVTLIAFAMGIVLVGDAVAEEKGKVAYRSVWYITTNSTLKVPDVEGHTNILFEAKGIVFYEKWGSALAYMTNTSNLIKGTGTFQGYAHTTFPDGSTITLRFEGKSKGGGIGITGMTSPEGTWTYVKGTGKFENIKGRGTMKSYVLGIGQFYTDSEGEYTLP